MVPSDGYKALSDLNQGDIFRSGGREYMLALGYEKCRELLGCDPPSLPIKSVERRPDRFVVVGDLWFLSAASDVAVSEKLNHNGETMSPNEIDYYKGKFGKPP
ncbi:MAG: hypothetical protein HYW23_00700 [Candidatus Aenigmarchaeota archaeon]|nr:hypothetical protein [Candidatus Aenigmarchaeota archaeon]